MQVFEAVRELGGEVSGPGGEGARFDVVDVEGVVGESEEEGGRGGGEEGEGVDWVGEGGEDAVVLSLCVS